MTRTPELDDAPEQSSLPELRDGEMVTVTSVTVVPRKTKKPSFYTEGSLLDDMKAASRFIEDDEALRKQLREISGLGTAATRDSIIEGLKHDKYLKVQGKHLIATDKGRQFIHWLEEISPETVDVALTARWEAELSLVAQRGGGAAFEAQVQQFVQKLVSTLKDAPPLRGVSTSTPHSENPSMSDTSEKRASTPTDKMLEFAKSIAKSLSIRVPDEVMTDFDACREFIDANKEKANAPSDKQLEYAKSIAKRKNLTIPPATMADRRALSRWIDENLN